MGLVWTEGTRTWSTHTNHGVGKVTSSDEGLNRWVLQKCYTCAIESALTGNITTWYSSSSFPGWRTLGRVVNAAQRTVGGDLNSLEDSQRCRRTGLCIINDHPNCSAFSLLRSGRRYRTLKANRERLRFCFIPADNPTTQLPQGLHNLYVRDQETSLVGAVKHPGEGSVLHFPAWPQVRVGGDGVTHAEESSSLSIPVALLEFVRSWLCCF